LPVAIRRDGLRLHYDIAGTEGPPVVLLMGIGISSRAWLDTPKRLADQSATPRTVITIDNRGTGQSSRPRRPFRMGDMADDVAAVLDHAGIATTDVLGISLGGMIAQEFAIRHPSRVRGLALLCTTPGFPLGTLPNPKAVAHLVKGFLNGLRGDDFERLMAPAHRLAEARAARKKMDWQAMVKGEVFDPMTLTLHLIAAGLHASAQNLDKIRCPTLVVSGHDDLLIPADNSRRIARAIPGATLRILPEVGHDILSLEPDCIAQSLAFLDQACAS